MYQTLLSPEKGGLVHEYIIYNYYYKKYSVSPI